MARTNKVWRLMHRPEGEIRQGDLQFRDEPLPALKDGEVLVRTVYLSVDPTNRIWMSDVDQYMPPVGVGDVMRAGVLGVVEDSKNAGFAVGDVVQGLGGYQLYTAANGAFLNKVPAGTGLPLTAFMSVLGFTTLTAYFGLLEVGQPKAGETVVVSTAAGAVGSMVVQMAKLKGCRVVGLTSTDEKCRWVTSDLGADACINYKKENVLEALRRHCPKGIDVYFENVGGEILDAALTLINFKGRIPVCGLISTYNDMYGDHRVPGPTMFRNILMKRVRVEGFIVSDFAPRFGEAMAEIAQWVSAGKLKWKVDIVDGLENAPQALARLFSSGNMGKLLVKVSPEP